MSKFNDHLHGAANIYTYIFQCNETAAVRNLTIQDAPVHDVRDELKALNRNLAAQHARLVSIRRNTAWSRKKRED